VSNVYCVVFLCVFCLSSFCVVCMVLSNTHVFFNKQSMGPAMMFKADMSYIKY
jgi:hypothetical protein